MIYYKVIRPKDAVIVGICKNKNDNTYSFINFTKDHICPCKFDTIDEAINDLKEYKNKGKVLEYIKINI